MRRVALRRNQSDLKSGTHASPRPLQRAISAKGSSSKLSTDFHNLRSKLSKRDPLHNVNLFTHKKLHHQSSALSFIVQSAIYAMLIMVGIQLLAVAIWPQCSPGVPCKDKKSQLETFSDIIDQRVPPLKKFADSSDFSQFGSQLSADNSGPARDCVAPWMSLLRTHVGSTSQPAVVHELMGYLRLSNMAAALEAVGDLLTVPQPIGHDLEVVENCTRDNAPVHASLCELLDRPDLAPMLRASPDRIGSALTFATHIGLVLEALTRKFAVDWEFRVHMASHFARISDEVEAAIVEWTRDLGREDKRSFLLEKWESMLTPNTEKRIMELRGGNIKISELLQYQLAINIIEASDTDRIGGVDQNANLGIALAASTTDSLPISNDNRDLVMPYRKGWYDAYIAWNLIFVSSLDSTLIFPKLLIPSIVCTAQKEIRDVWMLSRVFSLKATMAITFLMWPDRGDGGSAGKLRTRDSQVTVPIEGRQAAAAASAAYSDIPVPCQEDLRHSRCYGHGSLYKLWHYLKPYEPDILGGTSTLSNKWFMVYFTVTAWSVVAAVGLGSEVTLGHTLMQWIATHESGTVIWHLAQMSFSLMLAVAFTASGGYGMPFLAVGLWKFGFPETVNCLVMFHTAEQKFSVRAIAFLIDGYGTLLHHFSTSFTIVALMMHMFPHDRAITAACIVPIMQHMFILVKYHAHNTYLFVELALEAWFQWEVISNISAFETPYGLEITRIGRGMAMTMLFAHWLYLAGSVLHMIDNAMTTHAATLAANEAGHLEEGSISSMDDCQEKSISSKSSKATLRKQSTVQQFLEASEVVQKGKEKKQGVVARARSGITSMVVSAELAAETAVVAAETAVVSAETAIHKQAQAVRRSSLPMFVAQPQSPPKDA